MKKVFFTAAALVAFSWGSMAKPINSDCYKINCKEMLQNVIKAVLANGGTVEDAATIGANSYAACISLNQHN